MDIAIIGAGASGLICAVSIAQKAKLNNLPVNVTLYESKDKPGKKILATGNGRCNMMNRNEGTCFFDKNSFSCYALERYNVKSNLDFFASLGLYTRSDEEGRIYPLSNQASSVLDALRFACQNSGVNILVNTAVTSLRYNKSRFLISDGKSYDKVVLACGGKASVKGFNGYDILKQVGHKVTAIHPSLSKLEVQEKNYVKQLKGIKQKGEFSLWCGNTLVAVEKGELLFTDYGLSGIAIMQLSAYATRMKGELKVRADFVKELSCSQLVTAIADYASGNISLKNENLLSGFVPKRLGEVVIKKLGINLSDSASQLTVKDIKSIVSELKNFTFTVSSVRGFDDAQVTAGGADTEFFNRKTMESLKIKGLYCIGELLDVDGMCGGYNLHWAWSSGRLCAESIIKELLNRKG